MIGCNIELIQPTKIGFSIVDNFNLSRIVLQCFQKPAKLPASIGYVK